MTHPYASAHYANAFADTYVPVAAAGMWMLKRPIAGTGHADAMGCYPVCVLDPATDFDRCFSALREEKLVSLVLVTDIFHAPAPEALARAFDHCRPYKLHYLYDFTSPQQDYSQHHRYEVKQARKGCDVRIVALKDYLPQWTQLYGQLVARHKITGIQTFSDHYFTQLAMMDGVTTVAAFDGKTMLAAHIWVEHGGVVYSHLAASGGEGYSRNSSYAIYDYAIGHFREKKARVMDFGGGAGTETASDGLRFFKKGFSNRAEENFLCGKILDEAIYRQLCRDSAGNFFPAYRKG